MTSETQESAVTQKTLELCQAILDQPEFQTIRRQVDVFLADEAAKGQYQLLMQQGELLQHKQQMGVPLSDEEIAQFEKSRESLLNNAVARDFLDAQQGMQKLQDSVVQYVSKTFELGRVPNPEDLSGSCGSGCGCHH
jgi:cell fate (sporulation/competence/biofilm development) regulator YlbF (YheA/YmcA/DUF963 family)